MRLWGSSDSSSRVLISISTSCVSGAYVYYIKGSTPTVCFTTKADVVVREGEDINSAMLRALEAIGTDLIERGAPILRRETGSGKVDGVIVSVGGTWQETHVRTEVIQTGKPFVFSERLIRQASEKSAELPEERVSLGQSVIATILNGYDVPDGIGKKVNRAEIVILSSSLDEHITGELRARIKKLYHTHDISFVAFAPVAFTVLRDLYPHEKDFLVLSVAAEGTDMAFVKSGLLVDVGTFPHGINKLLDATRSAEQMTIEEESEFLSNPNSPEYVNQDRNAQFSLRAEAAKKEWLQGFADLIRIFAEKHPLPRSLFLISDPTTRDYLKRILDNEILHTLWLSDEPLFMISITPAHFSQYLRYRDIAETDVFLFILALYQKRMLGF